MKLEDQVCSLELAKRLKELGVKQEGLFYWYRNSKDENLYVYGIAYTKGNKLKDTILAFTVAELGEYLRKFNLFNNYYLEIDHYQTYDNYVYVVKQTKQVNFESVYIEEKTEANARAKMLIWLIENGNVKV